MRDMRHVWNRLMPPLATAGIRMLETSPVLRKAQAQTVGNAPDIDIAWHADIAALLDDSTGPVFGVANEFFDALPVAQLVRRGNAWHRRLVGIEDNRLGFLIGDRDDGANAALPLDPHDGMVAELCPQAEDVMRHLADAVARRGGAVLIIDYGRNGNPATVCRRWRRTSLSIYSPIPERPICRTGSISRHCHAPPRSPARVLSGRCRRAVS